MVPVSPKTQLLPNKKRPIIISAAITVGFYALGTLIVLYTIFAFGLQNTQLGTLFATICLYTGLTALAFNKRWGWLPIAFFQFIIAYGIQNTTASLVMLVPGLFFAWTFFRRGP
jgi:hypothetical protein